ncbi:MAG: TVP38/TMEM64 family protein [Desulfobacteraceae bacterium]|nr:TVP38/TMEM64 family protein [Desulfobacteraceae bacterium]
MNIDKKIQTRSVFVLIVTLLFLCGFYLFFFRDGERLNSFWRWIIHVVEQREALRNYVESWGGLAPVAFVFFQALQVVFAPIPGEATGLIGGFLFGLWLGFFYSTIGLAIGSLGAFVIARLFRRLIRGRLKRSGLYRRLEYLIEHQGIFISFVLFLVPGFPKDFLCYLLGLSLMPWQVFIILSTLGRAPGTLLLTMQGAKLYDGNIAGFLLTLLFAIIAALPAWYYRNGIYAWVERRARQDGNGGGSG